ncbi:hypothetical protein F4781DRAFT_430405 [Annulohypoxylon bovei var. microspora]|nr:hypothetical protein F4781DRAFT_430405 [Annulohypoxylon bovei var. microspora]
MATTSSRTCANCGNQPLIDPWICVSCHNVPKYQDDEPSDVYCNSICQQRHVPIHKVVCDLRIKRKHLLRAAILMKTTFISFRGCLYGRPLVAIIAHNDELHLLMDTGHVAACTWYYPFPDDVAASEEDKEAALSIQNCNASASICGPLAGQLLKGVASSMELLCVDAKPRVLARFITHVDDPERPADDYPLHTIVAVQIEQEKWVIDMTGSQFGFPDLISPYDKYMNDCNGTVEAAPCHYPVTETDDLDRSNFFPPPQNFVVSEGILSHRAHERAGRNYLKTLVDKRFFDERYPTFAADFLRRSEDDFQEGVDEWMGDVKHHMMLFVNHMAGKFYPYESDWGRIAAKDMGQD